MPMTMLVRDLQYAMDKVLEEQRRMKRWGGTLPPLLPDTESELLEAWITDGGEMTFNEWYSWRKEASAPKFSQAEGPSRTAGSSLTPALHFGPSSNGRSVTSDWIARERRDSESGSVSKTNPVQRDGGEEGREAERVVSVGSGPSERFRPDPSD